MYVHVGESGWRSGSFLVFHLWRPGFESGPVHKWIGFSVPTWFRGFYSEYYLWGFPPTSKTVSPSHHLSIQVSSGLWATVPRALLRNPWFHYQKLIIIINWRVLRISLKKERLGKKYGLVALSRRTLHPFTAKRELIQGQFFQLSLPVCPCSVKIAKTIIQNIPTQILYLPTECSQRTLCWMRINACANAAQAHRYSNN